MAHYRLYCIGASGNAYKVALYLNCAGLDWEPVGVDFAGGQMRDEAWRASTNVMGEVPVLEVDGRRLSQSGAILAWLAETTGKFAPHHDQRFEALRWMLFDNHKFTGSYAPHRFAERDRRLSRAHPSLMAYFKARVENAFGIVDKHLSRSTVHAGRQPDHRRLLTGRICLLSAVPETGFDVAAQFPAIHAWRQSAWPRLPGFVAAL